MAELIKSVKALGEAITGEKIEGDTLFDAVKDAGEKMTGKELEGKELNDIIAETAKEYHGGGSVVVTELPTVGEPHTIYELQEKKVLQSLVPMYNQQMAEDRVLNLNGSYLFVFETTEEMQNTLTSITPDKNYKGETYLNYITNEDKLIGATYMLRIPSGGDWKFTEATKVSGCKFDVSQIFVMEDPEYIVILKEYLGMYPEETETAWYTGRLWNDKLYTFEKRVTGILLGTPTVGGMAGCDCQTELPGMPEKFPSEFVFETIPYEQIINHQLYEEGQWIFTPKSEEITETSYWIYTNDNWFNVDDVGAIVLPVVSYGGSMKDNGLELSNFEFTVNGHKVECVQYKVYTTEDRTSYAGYITGISLPTENNTTYSISARFIGESSQISRTDALILKALDETESNLLEGLNILSGTMNLEVTGINTLSIVFMGSLA